MLFSIYPLYILWLSVKLSGRWYLFDDDLFKRSDADGVKKRDEVFYESLQELQKKDGGSEVKNFEEQMAWMMGGVKDD